MKLKLKNRTSFTIRAEQVLETEGFDPAGVIETEILKDEIKARSKAIFGRIKTPSGLNGDGCFFVWFVLRIDQTSKSGASSTTNEDENLAVALRIKNTMVSFHYDHTITAYPFGSLKPEQEWHSGHAKVWTLHPVISWPTWLALVDLDKLSRDLRSNILQEGLWNLADIRSNLPEL